MKAILLTEPAAAEQSIFAEAEAHPDASYAIVIMSPEIAGPLHKEGIEPNSHPGRPPSCNWATLPVNLGISGSVRFTARAWRSPPTEPASSILKWMITGVGALI